MPNRKTRAQAMTDRFYRTLYEFMLKPQLATASSPAMLLNLLYKALKADPSLPRAQAFAKRLLQVQDAGPSHRIARWPMLTRITCAGSGGGAAHQIAIHQQPAFAAAVLLLFSELLKHRPALWLMVNEPPAGADDDMEHFGDADKSATGGASGGPAKAGAPGDGSTSGYDPRRREPAAANADKSAFWELVRTRACRCTYRGNALTATVEDALFATSCCSGRCRYTSTPPSPSLLRRC